jgi:type I restriction enzyme M protein
VKKAVDYSDIPGFCKFVMSDEIRSQGYMLIPDRYVGAAETEQDQEPIEAKLKRLTSTLEKQFAESHALEVKIWASINNLEVPHENRGN